MPTKLERASPHEADGALHREACDVVSALQHAAERRDRQDPALQSAVARFAACARERGLPPERLIVWLKDLVRHRPELGWLADWGEMVLDPLVGLAIRSYYEPAGAAACGSP